MKKRVFCIVGCLVFLLLIACNKSNSATTSNTGRSPNSQKDPIIINDMADFEFTPGHDVPGTIFQTNMLWSSQNGKVVYATADGKLSSLEQFHEAPQRYDFKEGDPVTVVFKTDGKYVISKNIVSISAR